MKRGCGSTNTTETGCLTLQTDNLKIRECIETCTDISAIGCNKGNEIFESKSKIL